MTFFLQFFPDLVKKGHVYILETPLFRVRNKQETIYCYDETEKQAAVKKLGSKPEITRFKGLGEISPDEFKNFIGKDIRLEPVIIGLGANITLSESTKLTTVRGNLTALNLDITGNISAANLTLTDTSSTTGNVTGTQIVNNLKVTNLLSNRTSIQITNDTVVDSFPVNRYRTAKYTIRVASDDGYQALEVLLVHDDVTAYVTIYGSLSTSGSDMVFLTTTLSQGLVSLKATATTTNTTVNMIASYITD
jgi:hypothetical protein